MLGHQLAPGALFVLAQAGGVEVVGPVAARGDPPGGPLPPPRFSVKLPSAL